MLTGGVTMSFEFVDAPAPLSTDETVEEYGLRLEYLGFDEMRIRKEILRNYSAIKLADVHIFNNLSDARIRYITMIHEISPAKPHKGLVKKLASSIGITMDEAEQAVCRYEQVGGMSYIPWTREKNV